MVYPVEPKVGSRRSIANETDPWGPAVVRALVMLVVSVVVFVLVPNALLSYLAPRVVPRERDLLVSLWWAVAFAAGCVLFVRLQPRVR